MPKLENRLQLMNYLGAKQRNTVWSWCAVDEDEKKVYFSIWSDMKTKGPDGQIRYVVQEPDWGVDRGSGRNSAARNDHDEKLSLVFDQGYEAYGYLVVAKRTDTLQREIEETKTGFIFQLKLTRDSEGNVHGDVVKRIDIR